jgi:hypothetical protein
MVGWSRPRPGRFTTGKETAYLVDWKLCGPYGPCERMWNILPSPECDPRTVQDVTSRYTDWDIPAYKFNVNIVNQSIYEDNSAYCNYAGQSRLP